MRGRGRGGRAPRDQRWRTQELESLASLRALLVGLEGESYGAYKQLTGRSIPMGHFSLCFDHIQSDPFAGPSSVRARVSLDTAALPKDLFSNSIRKVALCDFLSRVFARNVTASGVGKRFAEEEEEAVPKDQDEDKDSEAIGDEVKFAGHGRGGAYHSLRGGNLHFVSIGQHILERNSIVIGEDFVEARLCVSMPGQGRRIAGYLAAEVLCDHLVKVVERSLLSRNLDLKHMRLHVLSAEDQEFVRNWLDSRGLTAFVRNGAILPRKSGDNDAPLESSKAIPFQSPASLQVQVELPNAGVVIKGMGISEGITLIVGGGFHGKSTLLRALEVGVYNHIPGDGREFVCVHPAAVKIRAEDGRAVTDVDISMFINNLPMKTSTERFSTNNASGSTSQASAISEALELDASALILDEDTCATNFMIRDHRMRMLVSPDKEPITPFLSRVRSIYQEMGVSSILVIGGSGEYFDVADTVIMMDKYVPIDVTGRAKAISSSNPVPTDCVVSDGFLASPLRNRVPIGNCLDPFVRDRIKVKACSKKILMFGTEEIDIAAAEQLVELGQVSSIGNAMIGLRKVFEGKITLKQALQRIDQQINERGLDSLSSMIGGRLARPRLLELAAVLNRYRKLKCL